MWCWVCLERRCDGKMGEESDLGLRFHALPGEREDLHLAGGESDGHCDDDVVGVLAELEVPRGWIGSRDACHYG
jgi:hypothetical protein